MGFGASLAAGVLFAVVIDFSPWLRRALYPLLVASQTIPILTLAPLLVLWFGFGLTSKAIVVTLVCFFPIVVALADGLRGADPELIRLYRSFGAGRCASSGRCGCRAHCRRSSPACGLPSPIAVIGAIFGEYVGASAGLGFYIETAAGADGAVMAAIVVTAALSIALFALTALIERVALPWYYAQGRGE